MASCSQSVRRLFDVLEYLVDPRVGIIQEVTEVKKDAGGPDLFRFFAKACNTKAFVPQTNFGQAGGTSRDRSTAMAKAIGEAIERYCSAMYQSDELPLHTASNAPFFCTPPESYALFSRKQLAQENFEYHPFTSGSMVRWTPAIDAVTGETQFVPAAMVYLPYFFGEKESPIVPGISTGLACHCSQAEAAISAICEVVERDAFTITWQAALNPTMLLLESLSEQNRELAARYEKTGGRVFLFNITLDHGIPTILSVLQYANPDAPALLVSAASHPSPEIAVRKTLEELALCRSLGFSLKVQIPPIPLTPHFDRIDSQLSHIRFFCEHSNAHLADFLFKANRQITFSELPDLTQKSPEEEWQVLVERISSVGYQVLLADVTSPDIKELGLWVLRAIVPGFHPLFFGHRFRALGGTRLWEVPQKLGFEGISPEIGDNPVPHPYP
ncbi:MAG: YcaO-like family protein [Nitrospirales bacterium]